MKNKKDFKNMSASEIEEYFDKSFEEEEEIYNFEDDDNYLNSLGLDGFNII